MDEELQDLLQGRLLQGLGLLVACGLVGMAIVAAAPALRGLSDGALSAAGRLPDAVRSATQTLRGTAGASSGAATADGRVAGSGR